MDVQKNILVIGTVNKEKYGKFSRIDWFYRFNNYIQNNNEFIVSITDSFEKKVLIEFLKEHFQNIVLWKGPLRECAKCKDGKNVNVLCYKISKVDALWKEKINDAV